jgi:penicillin-binding protein 1C
LAFRANVAALARRRYPTIIRLRRAVLLPKPNLGRNLGGAVLLAVIWLLWRTAPPALPSYADARAAWAPSEAVLLDRGGQELGRVRTDYGARRGDWVPLAVVSPALSATLIAAEDRRFREHNGVDWRAIGGSLHARLAGGAHPRGASTLSMQLAGLLAPELGGAGRRTLLQKIAQGRAALALERSWSKDQILEAYLNLAPTRGELVGVDATARTLFGTGARGITASQAAAYVALLPAPGASPAALQRRACVTARRAGTDCVAAGLAALAMLGGPPRHDASALAPQLAAKLLQPGQRALRTTLDARVQALAASALSRRLAELDPANARDGAAIVVDNASGEVLAYVASAGPFSRSAAVDGADAPRQAGSTLKPFLYARAIDRRLLTAASILDDSPVHLETASGLYVPQDYDRQFRGPVSVRSALGNSLNVPAVRALMLVGVDDFRDVLVDSGYRHLTEEGEFYGYSLALGSAEVTLLEQAAAYRALARGGLASRLRLTPGPRGRDTRVVSAEAAAIVADMMADPAAREATFGADSAIALPFWAAVKTGTSKAMRDNWCVGFTTRFTVAVWVGNFEGESMANVSGVTGAAPAWREIMLALHAGLPPTPPERPPGLERVAVRFAPAIEPARAEWFLPGTAVATVRLATAPQRPPRITTPADGARIALDPDIPPARQRIAVATEGAPAGARLLADGRALNGPLWAPSPGHHSLSLAAADGRLLDRIRLEVR